MTEYCPYIKYRRRPAVVPRSPSGRLGCGGRSPPTSAYPPALCRGVAAIRRSHLGVWPRRPRRKRRGRSSARLPGRGLMAARGHYGTRHARGRRLRRSVPRASFGFPAPLRRLVKACLASAAGRRLCRRARWLFAVSSAGGRRSASPPPLAVLAPPSARKPLRPFGRRCAAGLALRSGAPSAWRAPSARSGSARSGCASRLPPPAALPRSPALAVGSLPFPAGRRSPCSPSRCARPCPLRRASAAASLAARLPARRRGRRRLFWRFRRAAFSAGSARGDGGRVSRRRQERRRWLQSAALFARRRSTGDWRPQFSCH